jgi:Mn-dependent DtxR family transcriptional regulator
MLQMDIESNVWYADRFNKQELCNKLHISLPSLDKMIASLKERELLILIQRGKYKLNEQLTNGY